jgi:hypothetical protein
MLLPVSWYEYCNVCPFLFYATHAYAKYYGHSVAIGPYGPVGDPAFRWPGTCLARLRWPTYSLKVAHCYSLVSVEVTLDRYSVESTESIDNRC